MIEIFVFIFGLVFGSFLNMLIYRLPIGLSLFNPVRSVCPSCEYQIKWYENIPLISYFILKGKCCSCKNSISFIYPSIELLTAFITTAIYLKYGYSLEFLVSSILFYTLIVLSMIDFKFKAVPDYLLVLALIFTFSFVFISGAQNLSSIFLFAGGAILLEFIVTYYIQNIKAKIKKDESLKEQKALGEGDIPIFAVIGGVLGLKLGMVAIFLASIFAMIPALFYMKVKKEIDTPFIPFLSLGLLVVFIFERNILMILENIGL